MQDRLSAAAGASRLGLFDSAKAMLATLVAMAHNRLQLLSTELQEEVTRVALLLLWGAVALFFAFLGIAFVGLLVVIAWWDDHPLLAAGLIAVLFLLLAVIAGFVAAAQVRAKPLPFNASLGELAKDYDQLKS